MSASGSLRSEPRHVLRFPAHAATAALLLAVAAWAQAGAPQESSASSPAVFVSILPQAYFVERIAAGRVQVEVMVEPGQEPHTFEPTPQQLARLAEADLYFRIGVEFENSLMPRIGSAMPDLRVVDCREGIVLRRMENEDHEHEETDPHIWLSVRNAIRIAATICDALRAIDPEGADAYDRSCHALVEDLEALDRRIASILAPLEGREIYVFHPAFGYFAEDYGLEQVAVESGGAEPSARELARLIERAKEAGVRVLFVQPQFSPKSARAIAAEIGGAVVPLDPLAHDYIENLEGMARVVEEALR